MPTYSYRAVGTNGRSVVGVLTAENYQVALRMLDEQALFPVKVTEGAEQSAISFVRRRRVKGQHLTTFYSQLADLLKAGVPMLRSLDVLGKSSASGSLGQTIKELREDVAGGMPLGEAMDKHPHAFTHLQAAMVKAGESGGFLEDVLHRIAVFSEKQDELRNKVFGAMVYPAILVFVGGSVITFLMAFVVPRFREYLRPETFNMLTYGIFAVANVLENHLLSVFFGIGFAAFLISVLLRTEMGRTFREQFQLKAPILGRIMTMVAICRFCRILGTMLHNGVPILQALRISKDSAGNRILADIIERAADSVKKGAALSAPLGESGMFPLTVVDMIAVAEESNTLEHVLVQIADTNEARTARQIDLGVRVLEPILLVFMAAMVLCIAVGLLLPILTMGSAVH